MVAPAAKVPPMNNDPNWSAPLPVSAYFPEPPAMTGDENPNDYSNEKNPLGGGGFAIPAPADDPSSFGEDFTFDNELAGTYSSKRGQMT